MKSRCLVLLAVVALVAQAVAEPPPLVEEAAYDGFLPGAVTDDLAVVLVRDAETGRPIPGASVRQVLEEIHETVFEAPFVAQRTTDAYGLAWFRWEGERQDCHWVVDAPGYAPQEAYGFYPDDVMDLKRGRDVEGRLLDAHGAPLAGAEVQYFLGCGHSPSVRRVAADADGRFLLRGIDWQSGDLWSPLDPGGYMSPSDPLDVDPVSSPILTRPGVVARGRVVDAAGRPLPGIVVVARAGVFRRPHSVTDRAGDFGVGPIPTDSDLAFFARAGRDAGEPFFETGAWDARVPLLVVKHDDPEAEEDDGPTVEVSVVVHAAPGVSFVGEAPVTMVCLADGEAATAYVASKEEPPRTAWFDVPAGRYLLAVGDAFSAMGALQREVVVPARADATFEVTAERRPLLSLEGDPLPPEAWASVVADGERRDLDLKTSSGWPLEAGVRAAVQVAHLGRRAVFPVEPAVGGVRRCVVRWPRPTRVFVPRPAWASDLLAVPTEGWVDARDAPGGWMWETYREGRTEYAFVFDGAKGRRMEIELPPPTGRLLVLPHLDDMPLPRVRLLDGAGRPVGEAIVDPAPGTGAGQWESNAEGEVSHWDLRDGGWIHAARPDGRTVPLRVRLDGDAPYELRWGDCTLDVLLRSDAGEPLAGAAWVGGWLTETEDGRIRIEGLSAGAHVLLLGARGHASKRVRLQFFEAGSSHQIDVRLPALR
ncbi:MAG: carboxypeptidase-like regulatory domain-containing protein [Planctomycetota bacterium]